MIICVRLKLTKIRIIIECGATIFGIDINVDNEEFGISLQYYSTTFYVRKKVEFVCNDAFRLPFSKIICMVDLYLGRIWYLLLNFLLHNRCIRQELQEHLNINDRRYFTYNSNISSTFLSDPNTTKTFTNYLDSIWIWV